MPFNLSETKEFLRNNRIRYTKYNILQIYLVMRGIPFYLEKIKKGESIVQTIDRLYFTKDGILNDEFNIVFASLYNYSRRHEIIFRGLSKVRIDLSNKFNFNFAFNTNLFLK